MVLTNGINDVSAMVRHLVGSLRGQHHNLCVTLYIGLTQTLLLGQQGEAVRSMNSLAVKVGEVTDLPHFHFSTTVGRNQHFLGSYEVWQFSLVPFISFTLRISLWGWYDCANLGMRKGMLTEVSAFKIQQPRLEAMMIGHVSYVL